MKKTWALGVVAVVLAVFVFGAAECRAAQTLLGDFIKNFSKLGVILDLRALPDGSYDIVIFNKGEVRMYKIKGHDNFIQTPIRKYDVEKLAKLTGGAGKAQSVYMGDPQSHTKAVISCITLRESESGYEFLVSVYFPTPNDYRKSFVVDASTWKLAPDAITLDTDPRKDYWSKEEEQAESNDLEKVKPFSTRRGEEPKTEGEEAAASSDESAGGAAAAAEPAAGGGGANAGPRRGGAGGQGAAGRRGNRQDEE